MQGARVERPRSQLDRHGGTLASLNAHPLAPRPELVVVAGAVAALVWELDGNAEVAIATAALVLQLIEMTRPDPL